MAFLHKRIWKAQVRDALVYWVYIPAGVIMGGKMVDRVFRIPVFADNFFFAASAAVSLFLGLLLKITFVFSSHDPLIIERARRVITLLDGRIANDVRR